MKTHVWIFVLTLMFATKITTAQNSCSKIKNYVILESTGDTYGISNNSFLKKVTFHQVKDRFSKSHYYVFVQFSDAYLEYVYKVNPDTKSKFLKLYEKDAKKAFMIYIQPYNNRLYCGPSF